MTSTTLPTFRFTQGACIAQTQVGAAQRVTLDSPALSVMTDLTEVRAAAITADLNLEQAEQAMIHQGVRMLFVMDRPPCVDGIVTLGMLHGEGPIKLLQQRHVRRADLKVADVMSKLSDLDVLALGALGRAAVRDVAAVLQHFGMQHILVADDPGPHAPSRIRGVISLTQVERQLGTALPSLAVARTFAEIELALI